MRARTGQILDYSKHNNKLEYRRKILCIFQVLMQQFMKLLFEEVCDVE